MVLSIFSTIKLGECTLKCFICESQSDPNCVNPEKHKMPTQDCLPGNLADMKSTVENLGLTKISNYFDIEIDRRDINAPFNCMKAVSKVHDKEVILRGCQLAPKDNLDVCKKLVDEGKDIVTFCGLCNENGCNSAPIQTMSISLIALLIPAFVLL